MAAGGGGECSWRCTSEKECTCVDRCSDAGSCFNSPQSCPYSKGDANSAVDGDGTAGDEDADYGSGLIVGVVVTVILVCLAFVAGGIFFVYRKREAQRASVAATAAAASPAGARGVHRRHSSRNTVRRRLTNAEAPNGRRSQSRSSRYERTDDADEFGVPGYHEANSVPRGPAAAYLPATPVAGGGGGGGGDAYIPAPVAEQRSYGAPFAGGEIKSYGGAGGAKPSYEGVPSQPTGANGEKRTYGGVGGEVKSYGPAVGPTDNELNRNRGPTLPGGVPMAGGGIRAYANGSSTAASQDTPQGRAYSNGAGANTGSAGATCDVCGAVS